MKNKFIIHVIIIGILIIALSAPSQAQAIISVNNHSFVFEGNEFESDTLVDTLIIANGGDGVLNWDINWNESWLTVTPISGIAPDTVEIKVTAENLSGAGYSEIIRIYSEEASNSPRRVFVTFIVEPFECSGKCGDANEDDVVGVSDAIWIINYVFIGGGVPSPVLACGDANGDCYVNISDAIWILNYVFTSGYPPAECCVGGWDGQGGNCCPFES